MRRLIICTGHAEDPAGSGEKVETCMLVWTYVRKASSVKELPGNAELPDAEKAEYQSSYKVYHYVRPTKGTLGILTDTPPSSYSERFDTEHGALVTGVKEGSPSAEAIQEGDIIVSINDIPYVHGQKEENLKQGGENEITVYRDGEVMTKTVYLP